MKVNLVCLFVFFCFSAHSSSGTLKAVFLIHRHGDRTPIRPYANDPYGNDSFWSDGWGQLTANGKRRMYKLGQFIRSRYNNFLNNSPRELFIRSSAAERCLESAQLVAAGMYPPEGRWVWSSQANWLPFPIQTEPRPTDGILNPQSVCPVAENEKKRLRTSPENIKWQEEYHDLFNYLTLNTGQSVPDMFAAEMVYDTLKIQKELNLKLPEWVNDRMLSKLSRICAQTFYVDNNSSTLHRLRAGLLLKELRQRFKDITEPNLARKVTAGQQPGAEISTGSRKMFIYSSHDTLVAALLSALGTFNMLSPPYGASIIFELHTEGRDGEHVIKSYYLNETESEVVHPLRILGCGDGESCKLGEFLHATEELIPDNWRRECGLSADETSFGSSGIKKKQTKANMSQMLLKECTDSKASNVKGKSPANKDEL